MDLPPTEPSPEAGRTPPQPDRDRPLRVLLVDNIRNEIGGGHLVLARLANRFHRHPGLGVEPFVLMDDTKGFCARFLDPGVPVERYSLPGSVKGIDRRSSPLTILPRMLSAGVFALSFGARLVSLCRRHGIGLVHANGITPLVLCAAAVKLSGRKLVYHLHDTLLSPDGGGNMSTGGQRILRFFMKGFADAVVANSQFTADTVPASCRRLAGKLTVIHNGIEINGGEPAPRLREGRLRLLSFGRLDSRKGFQMGIEAVELLRARWGIEVEYTILGEGPYRADLESLSCRLGVADLVCIPGFSDDVAGRIRESDAVLVPSLWQEPFGLTVIESMVERRVVVASAVGGIPEIIEDGRTGMLVGLEDMPRQIAERVAMIAASPDTSDLIALRARQTVLERFSMDRMAAGLTSLYSSVMGGEPRG